MYLPVPVKSWDLTRHQWKMLTASATMEGPTPSSRIPKAVLLSVSVKLAVAQNSAERQKFNEVNCIQSSSLKKLLSSRVHYIYYLFIIMQKVQICMTERVLNLIQLQGLKLSLSDVEVWYQLSEHINFEFVRFKARVGDIKQCPW